jgi:hypothetical protein
MIQEQKTEPPSRLRIPLFMLGQDSHGNWVVQDQSRTRGGLFVDRIDALRFVRSENANRTQAYIAVSGVFELDIARATSALQRQPVLNMQQDRRVAWFVFLQIPALEEHARDRPLCCENCQGMRQHLRGNHNPTNAPRPVRMSAKSDIREERVYVG